MHALSFRDTQFDIVDRNGQPWLRGYQIGTALGYTNQPDTAIRKIFDRNADEFTSSMTALVELDTAGGKQQVRIFSLRGVHLLAMLSRTKVAKEFRRWVLDVLEGIAEVPAKSKALPDRLTPAQQRHIQNRVAELARAPGNSFAAVYRSIKDQFQVGTYKDIPASAYPELCQFLLTAPLEGEWQAAPAALPAPARFADIIGRPLTGTERWMVYTDGDTERYMAIPLDAWVMTPQQMLNAINTGDGLGISTDTLFAFVAATTEHLKRRAAYQARRIQAAQATGLNI